MLQRYSEILLSSAGLKGREIQSSVLTTLHKSGNSLNYNPHIHLIGTRELVDTKTGMYFLLWPGCFFICRRKTVNFLDIMEYIPTRLSRIREILRKACGRKRLKFHSIKKMEKCPDCGILMLPDTIFSFPADREIKKLVKIHTIIRGYFKPNVKAVKKSYVPIL